MAIKGTPTRHASEDRLDRITMIALTIGFGRVIKERMIDDKWYQITDTGVMVVRNQTKEVVITMWAANIKQINNVYEKENVPQSIINTVKANKKKFPKTYEM